MVLHSYVPHQSPRECDVGNNNGVRNNDRAYVPNQDSTNAELGLVVARVR